MRLPAMLRRFGRVEDAAAAVEFALILPIMLLVYIGTVEASALISMDRKVQSAAGALGDLVARSNQTITATELTDLFQAAAGIMTPFPADPLAQVVTQVSVAADGSTVTVDWSRQFHGGTMSESPLYAEGTAFSLPEAMINVSLGQSVVVSEATYSYLPLYGIVFDQAVNLRRESFYLPRYGAGITVQ